MNVTLVINQKKIIMKIQKYKKTIINNNIRNNNYKIKSNNRNNNTNCKHNNRKQINSYIQIL